MDFGVKKPEIHQKSSTVGRLKKRIVRLKDIALQYKQAKCARDTLISISNIASKAETLNCFYQGVHQHLQQIMPADNFFIATLCTQTNRIDIPFFVDEKDDCFFVNTAEQISKKLWKGLTGHVIKTGETFLFCGKDIDEQISAQGITPQGPGCKSWLGTPIMHGGTPVGVIVVQSYSSSDCYGQPEIELLSFICQHIEGVTERLKQHAQLEQAISIRTRELITAYNDLKLEVTERIKAERLQSSLYKIANLSQSYIDDNDFYHELHNILCELLEANDCYIAMHDKKKNWLNFPFYSSGDSSNIHEGRSYKDGLTEYVMKIERPILLSKDDILLMTEQKLIFQETPFCLNVPLIKQWMGTPLIIQQKIRGSLVVHHNEQDVLFHEKDLELLNFVGQHIAAAIERKESKEAMQRSYKLLEKQVDKRTKELEKSNKELEKEISRRKKVEQQLIYDAKHDPLTGLPNRAMFMERLQQAINHVQRHSDDTFALMFIDLDKFKLINDTLGHIEGDRFLVETADRLKLCIRQNDTLGRLGGDEFVILLDSIQHTNDAIEIADRVLQLLSQPYSLNEHKFYSSASIGITISTQTTSCTENMLKNADMAMYQAKAKGRGRYVLHQPSHTMNPTPKVAS
ncbi:bifunctional diguanylate cyclase/phosphodiesterase [Shewanella sp. OPT22]|nr:bifunctional diguanylate cyclase/phosphodiesterase [Shewanella sp. OPT22]